MKMIQFAATLTVAVALSAAAVKAEPVTATVSLGAAVATIPTPVAIGVIAAGVVAKELQKPKPFCRVIKVFKKKKRC